LRAFEALFRHQKKARENWRRATLGLDANSAWIPFV
jgi:hypothetical protein